MGMDIHIRLTKYNKETNLFEELTLYKPGEEYYYDKEGNKIITNPDFKKVRIFDGRNSEMFYGMKDGNENDGYGYFPWVPIKLNSLEPKLKKEIEDKMGKEQKEYTGYFDFYEITLADMKLYLNNHPKVADYDADEKLWDEYFDKGGPKPEKTNLIQYLYEEICNYAFFADNWSWGIEPLSAYKVLFYFDW